MSEVEGIMKNLYFIEKIMQKEIDDENLKRSKSQFPFIKNKKIKFKTGFISGGNICEELFYLIFDKNIFTFHSGVVDENTLSLVGYRHNVDEYGHYYLDPICIIDDTGVIKCNCALLGKRKDKEIRNYIASKLSETDKAEYIKYLTMVDKLDYSHQNSISSDL